MWKLGTSLRGVLISVSAVVFANAASGAGLSVGPNGDLLKDGKPFRSIGVNYADAFWRVATDPTGSDTSYVQGFETLGAMGINCARIAASPYWPSRFQLFIDDEQEYLRRLDGVIQAAEANDVGLVMSLFWESFTVPDLVGETRNQWGNRDSETIAFMKRYTRTIVSRYVDSPAVWVWEFGAEYSLKVDMPNAADHRSPIVPSLGTPSTRNADDEMFSGMILFAFQEFADIVREIDPTRPITTGNALPRNFAESIRHTGEWSEIDDAADFESNMASITPSPMDMISIHLYPENTYEDRFALGHRATYDEILGLSMKVAIREKKPLFVGEWGVSSDDSELDTSADVEKEFRALLEAIVRSGAPLAAVWNFDFADGANPDQIQWTITATNRRSYMLEAIAEANARVRPEEVSVSATRVRILITVVLPVILLFVLLAYVVKGLRSS